MGPKNLGSPSYPETHHHPVTAYKCWIYSGAPPYPPQNFINIIIVHIHVVKDDISIYTDQIRVINAFIYLSLPVWSLGVPLL
jgi:hypothetical protein